MSIQFYIRADLIYLTVQGGEKEMDIMQQLIAVVIFGACTVVLPTLFNKWSDSRAGVR